MTKLKRCPCCHSDDVGPSYSFPTEDEAAGITIRCGNCGLMLTPVEHPTDDDGDLYDEDSDYVEEILDDLAYDWNKRAKDSKIDSFVLLGKEILDQIDKYANKVHGVEQIHQVDLLRKRVKELEEIHNKEFKENLVKAAYDTGTRITQGRHRERVTEGSSSEPAHWDGAQRPMDWDGTSVAPAGERLTMLDLSEILGSSEGTYVYSASNTDSGTLRVSSSGRTV